MNDETMDRIFTYAMGPDGVPRGQIKEIEESLANGYRILSYTATNAAGPAATLFVTVVLTKADTSPLRPGT